MRVEDDNYFYIIINIISKVALRKSLNTLAMFASNIGGRNIIKGAIVFLLIYFTFIMSSEAIDDDNTSIEAQAREIAADILLNSEKPINAVIAIDVSASMYGQNFSKSSAIEIVNSFIKRNNRSNKLGYVSWSHYPVEFIYPSSNYEYLANNLSRIKFKGNTCFKAGLSKSIELLKNVSTPQSRNILIVISDGLENCNRTEIGNLTCDQIQEMIPHNIEIYTIKSSAKNDDGLLNCITLDKINEENTSSQRDVTANIPSRNPFKLIAQGNATKFQDIATKVNVTKIVEEGTFNGPRIRIRIEAPDGPNVSNALVMALDSSGSMGIGGNPLYGRNLREAMNPALEEIGKRLPNSTIAILSWDNDIDFVYGFSQIDNAIRDIKNKMFFVSDPLYMKIFNIDLPFYANSEPYPDTYYRCDEEDATDFNQGLSGAINLLKREFPNTEDKNTNTAIKTIIFVTARSEFIPFDKYYIDEAKKTENDYEIYTIGIGVRDGSKMQKNLTYASSQTNGTYHYSSGSSGWTSKAIIDEISQIIDEIRAKKLLDNITIVDTLYPYLDVVNSSIKITKNGKILNYSSFKPGRNPDGTTTLDLRLNETLARGENIEISLDTKLNLSLPVDVSGFKRNLYWNIDKTTRISSITYHWHTNHWYKILLPENSLDF